VCHRIVLFNEPGFCNLEYEVGYGVPWLHTTIQEWNFELFREYKGIFKSSIRILRTKGFKEVFTAIPANDNKLLRFTKLFGFKEHRVLQDIIILSQEI